MPAAHAPSSPPPSATPSPSTLAWPSPPSSSAPLPPQLCPSPVSAAATATVPLAHERCRAWIRHDPDRTGLGTNSAGAVVAVDCAQPSSRTSLHRRWVGLRLLPVPVDVMWLASRRHVCPVCVRRALRTSPWNDVPVVTFSALRRDLPSPPTRFTTSSKSKMGAERTPVKERPSPDRSSASVRKSTSVMPRLVNRNRSFVADRGDPPLPPNKIPKSPFPPEKSSMRCTTVRAMRWPPHKVDLPILLLLICSAPGCFQNGDGDILRSHAPTSLSPSDARRSVNYAENKFSLCAL